MISSVNITLKAIYYAVLFYAFTALFLSNMIADADCINTTKMLGYRGLHRQSMTVPKVSAVAGYMQYVKYLPIRQENLPQTFSVSRHFSFTTH